MKLEVAKLTVQHRILKLTEPCLTDYDRSVYTGYDILEIKIELQDRGKSRYKKSSGAAKQTVFVPT